MQPTTEVADGKEQFNECHRSGHNGESSRDFAGNCGSICRSEEIDVDEDYVHAFLTDDRKD